MENDQHILIFKTSIQTTADRLKVQQHLDKQQHIVSWTVDLTDEDFVLRVISQNNNHQQIIDLVQNSGYSCQILL